MAPRHWVPRKKGDRKWLKNHRKMLAYERSKAEREVEEAESAVVEATRRVEMIRNNVNRALLEQAREKARGRRYNLDWQHRKQHQLDEARP